MMGAVALLGVAGYVGSLWGQAPASKPALPSSRIALLNLSHVIKSYDKYKTFQEELKAAVTPFQATDMKAKQRGEALAKEMNDPKATPQQKEENEKQLKELTRVIEDNKAEAQKALAKKQEEQLKILYMDVRQVAERHAQANGYEMVLHYNDLVKPEEYWSAQNIARKMNAGSLMPLYYVGGIDISDAVIGTLNSMYKAAPRPAAAAPAATGTPTGAAAPGH
jgi:Skp family chaperone for outer membrane proteins